MALKIILVPLKIIMFQLLALQLPILSFRLLTVRKTCDHLETKLSGVDTSKLVISIDDERALVNAITSSFPDAKHVLCTRHMRQNVNQKLTDAFVDKSDRQMLLNKIFGEDGIIKANDTICFEEKCGEVETFSQSVSQPFLRYLQKRVKENLDKKRKEPELAL